MVEWFWNLKFWNLLLTVDQVYFRSLIPHAQQVYILFITVTLKIFRKLPYTVQVYIKEQLQNIKFEIKICLIFFSFSKNGQNVVFFK